MKAAAFLAGSTAAADRGMSVQIPIRDSRLHIIRNLESEISNLESIVVCAALKKCGLVGQISLK